jgi:ribose transport system permease protein
MKPEIRSGFSRYTALPPLLLIIILALMVRDFLQLQNILNIGAQIAGLLIASLGQLVVTLVAGIDLSVGSVVSLTSALVAVNVDPTEGVLLALAAGLVVGAVNGLGVTLGGIHPLVMTLTTTTFVQGLTYLVLPIPGGRVPAGISRWVGGSWLGVPVGLWWCLAWMGCVALVLHRTRAGLHLFAVGANPRSAQLNGLPITAIVVGAYVASSLLAVVAGLYLVARVGAGDPTLGASMALETVAVVTLGGVQLTGGIGSVRGVACGALTLGLVTNGINLFGASPFLRGIITGVLLALAVCAQRRRTLGL